MASKNNKSSNKVSNFHTLTGNLKISNWILFGALVVLLLAWPASQYVIEGKESQARYKAEILSYQLAQLYQESRPSLRQVAGEAGTPSRSRGPASATEATEGSVELRPEGMLGKDPWGQPFQYKILGATGDTVKMQIHSAGPDQQFEAFSSLDEVVDQSLGDDLYMTFLVPLNKN